MLDEWLSSVLFDFMIHNQMDEVSPVFCHMVYRNKNHSSGRYNSFLMTTSFLNTIILDSEICFIFHS